MNCNSEYKKGRILKLYYDLLRDGVKCGIYSKISRLLFRENITAGRWFVARTIKTFLSVGKLYRDKGSGRPNLLSANPNIQSIIDTSVKENDEITAKEIQQILEDCGYTISIATINRIRRNIGWSIRTTRYCQLIRETNKPKRLQWAHDNINDNFHDVIWTDESSVVMEQFKKRSYRKKKFTPKRKPKPKHPLKVHVWAGKSRRGKTHVCIFNGIMNADLYVDILAKTLIPFIKEKFPNAHRFMQDNDPKHTSRTAKMFMEENNINWWKTPAG